MAQSELKRHSLVFISAKESMRLWQELRTQYQGESLYLLSQVFRGATRIPGIVRRGEKIFPEKIALGFVPWQRLANGNRLRIATYVREMAIQRVVTPYVIAQMKPVSIRTPCMQAVFQAITIGESLGLKIGVLGSAGLEITTRLPYTDEKSDVDLLLPTAPLAVLNDFWRRVKQSCANSINIDCEVELPQGYGVKLTEILSSTNLLLGKSLHAVRLLRRSQDVVPYLQ